MLSLLRALTKRWENTLAKRFAGTMKSIKNAAPRSPRRTGGRGVRRCAWRRPWCAEEKRPFAPPTASDWAEWIPPASGVGLCCRRLHFVANCSESAGFKSKRQPATASEQVENQRSAFRECWGRQNFMQPRVPRFMAQSPSLPVRNHFLGARQHLSHSPIV